MKIFRILLSALFAMTVLTSFIGLGRGRKEKSLGVLWEEYGKAENLDQVKRMADILEDIRDKAFEERMSWDYYKAWESYVNVSSRRNWKLRDSLSKQMELDVRTYDEPLLTYMLDRGRLSEGKLLEAVSAESSRLKARRNEDVYLERNRSFRTVVANDYEYVLWDIFGLSFYAGAKHLDKVYELLRSEIGDSYPQAGVAEYQYIMHSGKESGRKERLQDLLRRYEGRAVGLLPAMELMEMEFEENRLNGSSEYFKDLKNRLESYEHERKMYRKGDDKIIAEGCNGFGVLINLLESASVQIGVEDGRVELALRNMDEIKVELIKDKDVIFEKVLENPARSFFAYDTLSMNLPLLDDGYYNIRCTSGKKEMGLCPYPKYTLSAAVRTDREGMCIYVADHKTGKPVDQVDVYLYKDSRKIGEALGLRIDGFTRLPDALVSKIGEKTGYHIVCQKTESRMRRKTSDLYFRGKPSDYELSGADALSATVMLDRSAFKLGETVRFKAVAYATKADGTMSVFPEGEKLRVKVNGPQGYRLTEMELNTNDFGSITGEFKLEDIKRQGVHTIWVYKGDDFQGLKSFVVDDFVLPSFDVTFDRPEKPFLPGDTLLVSGKVESFSGHPLSSARITASARLGGMTVKEERMNVGDDGSFSFSFADVEESEESYLPYVVDVKITDLTGETHSFPFSQYVVRSLSLRLVLENQADGAFCPTGGKSSSRVLADDSARVSFGLSYVGDTYDGIPVKYRLLKDGKPVREGMTVSGEVEDIDMRGFEPGLYVVQAEMSMKAPCGQMIETSARMQILKTGNENERLGDEVEYFFCVPEEGTGLQLGVGNGPVWAVVELFGDHGQPLESEVICLETGQIKTLSYDYKPEYPDALVLNVLYFRNSAVNTYSHKFRRPVEKTPLPLEFVRFDDSMAPGSSGSVVLRTDPDSEVLAAIFDVSTETIRKNTWNTVSAADMHVSSVRMYASAGQNGRGGPAIFNDAGLKENVVVGYGTRIKTSARTGAPDFVSVEEESDGVEEAIPFQLASDKSEPDLILREDFATSLAFKPFLRPSPDGLLRLDFNASDKISTFAVSVFAHDKDMNNAMIRRDMLVTLPVKLDVVQPQYLYSGDRYVLNASVSNVSSSPVSGVVRLEIYSGDEYDGNEPVSVHTLQLDVRAGSSAPAAFDISVPEGPDTLGFKVVFIGQNVSDGVFVTVPVYPAEQVLKEAHSAVLLHGMSETELLESLRQRFVNVSSVGAEYSEISVMDMFRDALPLVHKPEYKDAISQSEAMYVNLLACGLLPEGDDARPYVDAAMKSVDKILSCAGPDGGFSWFEGMKSSPIVTAVILERFAAMRDRGLLDVVTDLLGEDALDTLDEAVCAAVRYLDSVRFSDPDRPSWYGSISLWQYLSVRSMYVGIPFDKSQACRMAGTREYKEFEKNVKSLLLPRKGERWTDGALLSKVRMIRILRALSASEAGLELAEAWGIGLFGKSKLRRSMAVELASLKEYAVEHPSGGLYYPNAVIPWRGLLESEAYAHALICDLFKDMASDHEYGAGLDEMADSIRLWIMLQKETQQWSSDPGFVEAMASVYDASDAVKDTKVLILAKRYCKPFEDIKAAGNGFKLSVRCYRESGGEGEDIRRVEISDGDTLHVGEKIIAVYSVWSEENRSFVRLSVPHAACFRPENQLSGCISPYAYREVKADRTLYWIDVFPEETSMIEETLFVTQEGRFTSPVAEVESLYASHYRANDNFGGYVSAVVSDDYED